VLKASHTPGPWAVGGGEAGGSSEYVYCDDATGSAIAKFTLEYVRRPSAVNAANGRLIAAAPDLLTSLQAMLGAMDDGSDEPTLVDARAAVTRATGSAS
jgi:hypothetical protein